MAVRIQEFTTPDLEAIKILFTAYVTWLGADLSTQNYDDEFRNLPGKYSAERGGALFVARWASDDVVDTSLPSTLDSRTSTSEVSINPNDALGCVGLQKIDDKTCELKRLYVAPAARGLRVGVALLQAAMVEAAKLGYERMVLDTLPRLTSAMALYERMGFQPTERYNNNPNEGVIFLEKMLT